MNFNRILQSKQEATQLLATVTKILDDNKAEQIVQIDLEGKADFAYYMVVATATSSRHATGIADKIADAAKTMGCNNITIEGAKIGEWVLVDLGDIIIHLFKPETRSIFNIEQIWQ